MSYLGGTNFDIQGSRIIQNSRPYEFNSVLSLEQSLFRQMKDLQKANLANQSSYWSQ